MSNGGYRTDNLIGIAEKFNWESTLRSPGRNREADVRSTWDARRQLEGLEERTASAVAYLHRQLLDLQAAQSPKTSSDVAVRLDALEQKQQQTAHRLDAVADVANSCSKEQDAQEQRLQALQERAINAEAASQRVAGLLQELRRDVTEIFEDGRLSPRSLGGEELRSLVAEQRLSQLEVAVWSLQSMELPEVQLAVHAQDRRLADLETGQGQDLLQARHSADFVVEDGIRTAEGRPCEPAEELRQSVAEQRVSQLEAALWNLQRELPEMQEALHSQDRRLLSLESRLDAQAVQALQVSPAEAVEEALQDVADAGRTFVADAHEQGEATSNAGEEAAGGHQSMRRVAATSGSRGRDARGAEDGGGPSMSRSSASGPSGSGPSGPETSAGPSGPTPQPGFFGPSGRGEDAVGVGGDGDAGSGEAFGFEGQAGPGDGAAGAESFPSWPSWPGPGPSARERSERSERSSERTAGDGAAGLAGERETRETDMHLSAPSAPSAPSRRRPGPSGHLGPSGGDGAAGRSGGCESDIGHVLQSLGGDGAAGGGRAREGDFGGGAPSVSPEAPEGHPMPDEADRAAAPPAGISQGHPRQVHEQAAESEEFSPDSASQDFEDVQPQSLDDALLSLVSRSTGRGHDRQQSDERDEGSVPEFDVSEAPSRSSSDSCAREEAAM